MQLSQLSKKSFFSTVLVLAGGIYASISLQSYVLKHQLDQDIIEFESMVSNYTIALQQSFNYHQASLQLFSNYHSLQLSKLEHEINSKDLEMYANSALDAQTIYLLTPIQRSSTPEVYYIPTLFYAKNTDINSEMITITYNKDTQKTIKNGAFFKSRPNITIALQTNNSASSTESPHGFLVVETNIELLTQNLIESVMPEWLDVHLYLANEQDYMPLLSLSGQGADLAPVDPKKVRTTYSVFLPNSLTIGDSSLSILYLPDEYLHFNVNVWQKYSTLILGLCITLALCIYLVSQKLREYKINLLVNERTRDLKETAEKLESSRREQQIIFDTVPAQIWYKNLDNKIIRANKHASEHVGLPINEIEGKHASNFLPTDVIQDKSLTELPKHGIITQQLDKKNQKTWLQFDKVPYYNEQQEICGVIILCMNITELKNMTDALLESEERFQLAVEGTNDGIWDWPDINNDIQYWSPHTYELLGYHEGQISPSNTQFQSLLHAEDLESAIAARRDHLNNGTPYNIKYRLCTKNNKYRWFQAKGKATFHDNGSIRMTGSLSDIHELVLAKEEKEKMEAQLRQSQKLESIGQLAAGIAHEINTPIQFIGDNLRFIEESFSSTLKIIDYFDSILPDSNTELNQIRTQITAKKSEVDLDYILEEVPTALEQSLDGVMRVSSIVKAMKEFSHPSSDSMSHTDINRAISSTITVSKSEWKLVAEIKTNFDEQLPSVECFPGEFNQTILNIIVNAAHAIADVQKDNPSHTGIIKISTQTKNNNAVISISDNGKGMPKSVQERIFDPFYTTKEVGKGTGQGLSIAFSVITEKHHGSLKVSSQEGIGTTFTIEIPISSSNANSITEEISDYKKTA